MNLKRMVKNSGLVLAIIMVCFLATPALPVSADIPLPEEFYGDIIINGRTAPAGTAIVAKIGGVGRGTFTTAEAGKYGGSGTFDSRLVVAGEEADIGETTTFWINGEPANQTAVYEPGQSKNLDLSVEVLPLNASDPQITEALDYLKGTQQSDGCIAAFATSTWAVMAIAAAGEDPGTWTSGGDSIIDYLRSNMNHLGSNKATDWERFILAIAAAGENPRGFGGIDCVATLLGFYDGTQIGDDTMLNDDFWGILALKATGESLDTQIQNIKTFIINNQNSDGGWGWIVGDSSDADNTAAAVMALVAAEVSTSSQTITDGLNYLKTQQQNDGGFTSEGVTNAAVDSWVINAIVAAGQSPASNEWRKSGNNPVGHLLSLQDGDGAFKWTSSQRSNPEWITAYAITALLGSPYPVAIYTPPTSDEDGDGDGDGGGGGGGGGGGAAGITRVLGSTTSTGRFTEDITARSGDNKVELYIPEDTTGKSRTGGLLFSIRIEKQADPADPPEKSDVVGLVYDFGPDGATFDPAVSLTFEYSESKIPDGVAEENLVVAYWDEEDEEWIELEGTVDQENNTVTAEISHFTDFTILAHTRPASFDTTELAISPDEIEIGEMVIVSAIVTNTGDLTGTHEVTLKINGVEVEVKEVELIGGDDKKVSFSVTPEEPGTYTVDVDELIGSFAVKEKVESLNAPEAPSPPVPSLPAPVSPSTAPPSKPESPEQEVSQLTPPAPLPPPPSREPINWYLIGGIIAGVVVLGLLIFFLIRRFTYY